MVQAYIDKLPATEKEAEQTRLNASTIEYEVTLGEIQEDYAGLVNGDDVFRATQYPLGTAKYKAFSDKVSREQRELTKLDADMKGEQQAEVGERKARLYSDSIARHKKVIEVDLPALVPLIFEHHKELTQPELEVINGFENILSPLLNQATATFAGLSMPASVQACLTSTPDVSLINGAAALSHASFVASQFHPGAAGLLPQANPTAGRYPGQGSLYKPYTGGEDLTRHVGGPGPQGTKSVHAKDLGSQHLRLRDGDLAGDGMPLWKSSHDLVIHHGQVPGAQAPRHQGRDRGDPAGQPREEDLQASEELKAGRRTAPILGKSRQHQADHQVDPSPLCTCLGRLVRGKGRHKGDVRASREEGRCESSV